MTQPTPKIRWKFVYLAVVAYTLLVIAGLWVFSATYS